MLKKTENPSTKPNHQLRADSINKASNMFVPISARINPTNPYSYHLHHFPVSQKHTSGRTHQTDSASSFSLYSIISGVQLREQTRKKETPLAPQMCSSVCFPLFFLISFYLCSNLLGSLSLSLFSFPFVVGFSLFCFRRRNGSFISFSVTRSTRRLRKATGEKKA
jgi:hypothetical protein